jgi:glutathione S-transferase
MADESPTYTLINATPSPYGRKDAIAMYEKGIRLEVSWEKPWEPETIVGDYSPLQQLSILLHGTSEKVAAYDSTYILDYLELMHPLPVLLPDTVEGKVLEKKPQMLGERLMEVTATIFFEVQRETQNKPWMDRQRKKIETGLAEVAELIGERAPAVDDTITLGDIALGTTLCMFEFEGAGMPLLPEFGWREKYPSLGTYYDALIARPSFQKTEPIMFDTDLGKTV